MLQIKPVVFLDVVMFVMNMLLFAYIPLNLLFLFSLIWEQCRL